MGTPVDVIWSASCDGVFAAKRHTAILPPWAGISVNAENVAQSVCEDFFTQAIWEEWVGLDDDAWTVDLEIHSPAAIAGNFEVELTRVTKASARMKVPDHQSDSSSAQEAVVRS